MNKKISILLLSILLSFNLLGQKNTLVVDFRPSFLESSVLSIEQSGQIAEIRLVIYNKDLTEKESEVYTLKTDALQKLNTFLESYKFSNDTTDNIVYLRPNGDTIKRYNVSRAGNDGITVKGRFIKNEIEKRFQFWSPKKQTSDHKLIEILLSDLGSKYFKRKTILNYIELLEQYFYFGLGIKLVKEKPLTYKLFGSISINKEMELKEFFNSLPTHKKVYIDVSNFTGMGTRMYPYFNALITKNKEIYFVNPSEYGLKQLTEAGVGKTNIVSKSI